MFGKNQIFTTPWRWWDRIQATFYNLFCFTTTLIHKTRLRTFPSPEMWNSLQLTNGMSDFFDFLFCPSSTNFSLVLIMKQPNPAAAGSHTHQIMQYLSSSQSTSPALQFDEIFASWHTKLGGNSFVKYVHAYIYFEAQSFF